MFSQWRHAVESTIAQHSPKPSQDGTTTQEESAARGSLDVTSIRQSLPSSTQLADTALSTLRKTLATQRPASPVSKSSSPAEGQSRQRTTLEDRLRARFAIGEASNGTSPALSTGSTPSSTPTPLTDHPLSPPPSEPQPPTQSEQDQLKSPKSIPLPGSPVVSPTIASPVPKTHEVFHPLASELDALSALQLDQSEASVDSVTTEATNPETAEDTPATQDAEVSNAEDTTDPLHPDDTAVISSDLPSEGSSNSPSSNVEETTASLLQTSAAGVVTDAGLAVEPKLEYSQEVSPAYAASPHAEDEPEDPLSLLGVYDASTQGEEGADAPETVPDESISASPSEQTAPADSLASVADDVLLAQVDEPQEKATEQDLQPHPQDEMPGVSQGPDIESLQERLKLVEQRFAGSLICLALFPILLTAALDVSTSFKRLQAEKAAADHILRELTPVESISEAEGLRDFLQNLSLKTEVSRHYLECASTLTVPIDGAGRDQAADW